MHQMVLIMHKALITKLSCFIPCGSVWYFALVGDIDLWCGSYLNVLHLYCLHLHGMHRHTSMACTSAPLWLAPPWHAPPWLPLLFAPPWLPLLFAPPWLAPPWLAPLWLAPLHGYICGYNAKNLARCTTRLSPLGGLKGGAPPLNDLDLSTIRAVL